MRKTLWSALALAAILILAGCGEQSHTDGSGTDSATYTPDAGYTLGNTDVVQLNGFRAIDIEWVSGQVNVELYDGEGIQLSETMMDGSDAALKMEWQVNEDKGTLDIRSQPQLMSATEEKILTVKLPRSMVLYGLDIDAVSAGVSVDLTDEDTLSLSELDVTSVSGAISVYAANAGEISLSTTSGSISGSVRTQKLEADSVSGSIDLALDIMPTELEAETSSGSIVMQLCDLSTLPSPLPVEFKTTSGKLSSDVTFTTVKDAAWEFQTVSGNVEGRTGTEKAGKKGPPFRAVIFCACQRTSSPTVGPLAAWDSSVSMCIVVAPPTLTRTTTSSKISLRPSPPQATLMISPFLMPMAAASSSVTCRWRFATMTPSDSSTSPAGPISLQAPEPFTSPLSRMGASMPRVRASVAETSTWSALRVGPRMDTLAISFLGPTMVRRSLQAYWPG